MHAAVLHEHGATPVYETFEEPAGPPPLPSVVGSEGVGRIAGGGRRVYFGASVAPAVALGVAGLAGWLPLPWRAGLQAGRRCWD
jgi:hypothetical protein